MGAETTDPAANDLRACDCGHEVSQDRAVSMHEVVLCDHCYTPFDVDEWPDVIGETTLHARGRRDSGLHHKTRLFGLDERGRAVYFDGHARCLRTFVPKHDRAYQSDRRDARSSHSCGPEGLLRSRKFEKRESGPGPLPQTDYVTLPNGDHIVEVETSEELYPNALDEFMETETENWQAVNPDIVESFGLDDQFGTKTGSPLENKTCEECGYSEVVDTRAVTTCPDCESYKFH